MNIKSTAIFDFLLKNFFKKTITLTENLLNFNATYMDWKQPFESF